MTATVICCHGELFPAWCCSTCGARDTSRSLLAVHEQRHEIMRHACRVVGKVRVIAQIRCITPGCHHIQKARGFCKRCYARAWAQGRIHG